MIVISLILCNTVHRMLHRNDKRKITAAEDAKPVKRVGYVPRDRADSLTDTGLTSAGLLGRTSPPPAVHF